LFFPTGKGGWKPGLKSISGKKVTLLEYFSYLLSIRNADSANCGNRISFNPLHHGGKLFHQYLVDSYVKVEQDRLDFIRYNQPTLKVEQYQALHDYLDDTADEMGVRVGKTIILPSSFKGNFLFYFC